MVDSVQTNKELPKLYITQPDLAEPSRSMQSYYQSTNKYQKREENDEIVKKQKVASDQLDKKKFKDMTLKEKVIYFASMPFHVPKVKCELQTERKKYVGIIEDFQNQMVMVKVASKQAPVSIPIDHIKEINLIGF
ncbi:CotO family spore coat protein [Gracilibacillus kekensis]|uniref:Putative ribosome maturation factor RimP n=1 Tax=Gracilibacillus kekensis TaxID=1027249 RepID=A0A1M7IJC4_9BACI|nr:CotO family spore coat protein [Gracilibacillus kekensis]SHM40916.1 Putative ribosome maturation factor RimP [Gracilibacillus kekensis]